MADFYIDILLGDSLPAEFEGDAEQRASISADSTMFDTDLDAGADLDAGLSPVLAINSDFSEVINIDTQTPVYPGPYQATPKSSSQTLATAQLKMSADVVVNAVPYDSTPNAAGGETITIL